MIAAALGSALEKGETLACVLPGHGGRGRVEHFNDGRFVYRCDCPGGRQRSLTDVYVARVTGRVDRVPKQVFLLWKIRHCAVARCISLPEVQLPPLNAQAREPERKAYAGLRLFLRVRSLTAQAGEPEFTFSSGFLAEWMSIDRDRAKDGINRLRNLGLLLKTGETAPNKGLPANLYRLGGGK